MMQTGVRVLGVTLARGGSKGIPNKNIYKIMNKPLLAYTIDAALASNYISDYIVSTDSELIASVANEYGAETPFLRPARLSSDTATSADALLHAVLELEKSGKQYDYVAELMATNPLKTAKDIDGCIKTALERDANCCVAVHRIWDNHPSRVKMIIDGKLANFYPEIPESRRQDLEPPAYVRSGSIYVTRVDFLKAHRARYDSENTVAYILDADSVVNIDEMSDMYVAETKLKQRLFA